MCCTQCVFSNMRIMIIILIVNDGVTTMHYVNLYLRSVIDRCAMLCGLV